MSESLPNDTYLCNGKYRIICTIGQGGYGITYKALNTDLQEIVAIKEYYPSYYCHRDMSTNIIYANTEYNLTIIEQLKAKFLREAKRLYRIKHDNIVKVTDYFKENETAYIVMEFIDGLSLSDIVNQKGPMGEKQAVKYIVQLANALNYIHAQKLAHLDIKPDNIMVRNSDGRVIVIDFGISKQFGSDGKAESHTPIGTTTGFTPPEQYGPINDMTFSPKLDIYALGATLYYLLTGLIPPKSTERFDNHELLFPAPLSGNMYNAIYMAMEPELSQRPENVAEFCDILGKKLKPLDYTSTIISEPEIEEPTPPKPDGPTSFGEVGDDNIIKIQPKKKKTASITLMSAAIILFCLVISAVIILVKQNNNNSNPNDNPTPKVVDSRLIPYEDFKSCADSLSTYYLTEDILNAKSRKEKNLMRQTLLAKNGYIFPNDDYNKFFKQFVWYNNNNRTTDKNVAERKIPVGSIEAYNYNMLTKSLDNK